VQCRIAVRHRARPARAGRANADRKNILTLPSDPAARGKGEGAQAVAGRDVGRLDVDHQSGGIGGTAFTPIVNRPRSPSFISRGSVEAVFKDGEIQPRQMPPFRQLRPPRHDGADAIRFLR
jgi:pyruvate/2-oxoglutarate dehydrogenase complex dihydrolipoamide acyltransferase (E2) component